MTTAALRAKNRLASRSAVVVRVNCSRLNSAPARAASRGRRNGTRHPPHLLIHGEEVERIPSLDDPAVLVADERGAPEVDVATRRGTQGVAGMLRGDVAEHRDGVVLSHRALDLNPDVGKGVLEVAIERLELCGTPDRLRTEPVRDGVRMHQPIDR